MQVQLHNLPKKILGTPYLEPRGVKDMDVIDILFEHFETIG